MQTAAKKTSNQGVNPPPNPGARIIHQTLSIALTPCEAVARLDPHFPLLSLLDFYRGSKNHYSFIGFKPLLSLEAYQGTSKIITTQETILRKENPFELIQEYQQHFKTAATHPTTRLTGCAIGALSYDAVRYLEELGKPAKNKDLPDLEVNFFEYGLYFDYAKNNITLSKYVDEKTSDDSAKKELSTILDYLQQPPKHSKKTQGVAQTLTQDCTDAEFAYKVAQAKKYIKVGEVFQIVPSRLFEKPFTQNPLTLYKALLKTNPSPYHFYLKKPTYAVLAASPEKLVTVKNNVVTSTPLAGTKAIVDKVENTIQALLNNEKELAEHRMLVDLARNDVGRVTKPGTVEVSQLTYPLVLKNLVHLASDIAGELSEKYSAIDALKASFPAGTLSGAPKIRAMQLIDSLENSNRGFYAGTLFALDANENLDSCIILRNAEIANNRVKFRSGCGVVYDSDPELETRETLIKANGMLQAIALCEQGEII